MADQTQDDSVLSSRSRGAYFLASDPVFELAVAFLESFRRSNPDLPLCLIPFSDEIDRLLTLRKRYRFQLFTDRRTLDACDRIGKAINGRPTPEYRKLAMWAGKFRKFAYFDVDTIVLESVGFVWELLSDYDFIASQSRIPENVRFVWKKSIFRSRALSERQIGYAASTGFIASRKGNPLSLSSAVSALPGAQALSKHMALYYKEQPFLNYWVVTSACRYSSLAVIAALNPDLDIPLEKWAGTPPGKIRGRRLSARSPRVLFMHWAGLWTQGLHRTNRLWAHYRKLGP